MIIEYLLEDVRFLEFWKVLETNKRKKLTATLVECFDALEMANKEYLELIMRLNRTIEESEILEMPTYDKSHCQITLVDSQAKMDRAFDFLKQQRYLGYDMEHKPTFRKGQKVEKIDIFQLATSDQAFLFQTNKIELEQLFELLTSKKIKKISVGRDNKIIKTIYGFDMGRYIDLQAVLKKIGCKNDVGLKQMVARVLKKKLAKSKRVTVSNWASQSLKRNQITYAANDAFAPVDIFIKLKSLFNAQKDYLSSSLLRDFNL